MQVASKYKAKWIERVVEWAKERGIRVEEGIDGEIQIVGTDEDEALLVMNMITEEIEYIGKEDVIKEVERWEPEVIYTPPTTSIMLKPGKTRLVESLL